MSLSNKELLDKIKDEVWSHTYPFGNGEWKSGRNDDLWPIVCERFATEKAKELLPKEKKEPVVESSEPHENGKIIIEGVTEWTPVESQEEMCNEIIKIVCRHALKLNSDSDAIKEITGKFSITRLTP